MRQAKLACSSRRKSADSSSPLCSRRSRKPRIATSVALLVASSEVHYRVRPCASRIRSSRLRMAWLSAMAIFTASPAPRRRAMWARAKGSFSERGPIVVAPLAVEAIRHIDAVFDGERAYNGLPAEQPVVAPPFDTSPRSSRTLEAWMRQERAKLSRHADVAKAMDYMLSRWQASPASWRRAVLSHQQCRGAGAAWPRPRPQGLASVLRPWRRAGGRPLHPYRHGQAQQCRSPGLARLRACPHRRSTDYPAARAAAVALEERGPPARRLNPATPSNTQSRGSHRRVTILSSVGTGGRFATSEAPKPVGLGQANEMGPTPVPSA